MDPNPDTRNRAFTMDLAESQRTAPDQAWRQFATASSPEEFCQGWLALQCHAIGAVNDAVVVLQKPGADTFAPLAFWPEGRRDRSHLTEIAEQTLRKARGVVQPRRDSPASALPQQPDYQLAYPIRLDGAVRGVIALDVTWRDEIKLKAAMRQLQWGSGWLEVLLRRSADPVEAARLRIKLVLQLTATFLERPEVEEAATALVTELATQLGCDRVALGIVHGKSLRIEAISHAVQFDRHANLLGATVAAMTEALDQGEPVVYPAGRDGRLVVTFAHAELAQMTGAGGIVSLPLVNNGNRIGALTLERAAGHPFDAPAIELLEALAGLLAPVVEMQLARQRTLPAHIAGSAKAFWGKLVGPRHGGLKLATVLVSALILFGVFATGVYRVSGNARIEGEIQHAMTAPFQGYVRESASRAGDTVKKGQVLARLDDRDLKLERVRLQAQREQYNKQFREAMAKRDRTQVRLVTSQIGQVEAQLALVEEQLSRMEIVAPFDGVIVSGDLTQAIGAPTERGQVLFEIAPLEGYRVVLQVDERSIGDVRVGQRGQLVLAAMPGENLPIVIEKITPVSTAKEGRNVFRVEASLDTDPGTRLRPGMEGVAKVDVDTRRLVWIWTRELVNWVRLKWWQWTP